MNQVTIRPATEADLPAILDIYNDAILQTTASYDYDPHTLEMRQAWYATKQKQGFPVFVADQDGGVIGFSALGPFRAWAAYQYTVELSIYVCAVHRGKGIGKQLMKPLIETARQMGMHSMVAGIDASNEASLRLHYCFGFREVAHFHQVGYKFGRWLDLKFMELLLDDAATPSR
jgi:phosphinothricin acetyltransferase